VKGVPRAPTCLPAFYPPFVWWVLVVGRRLLFKRYPHIFEFHQIFSRYVKTPQQGIK
jgi:hypothetical protein